MNEKKRCVECQDLDFMCYDCMNNLEYLKKDKKQTKLSLFNWIMLVV